MLKAVQIGDETIYNERVVRDFSYRMTFCHNRHVSIQNNKVFVVLNCKRQMTKTT